MAYDFHGGWESSTGHQAAMTDAGGYDVLTAIDQFDQAGIDRQGGFRCPGLHPRLG